MTRLPSTHLRATLVVALLMAFAVMPAQAARKSSRAAKPVKPAAVAVPAVPAVAPAAPVAPVEPAAAPLLVAQAAAVTATPAVATLVAAATRPADTVRGAADRFDFSMIDAPAAQVFMQLGSGTGYNMLVSPEVSGTISISLKDTNVVETLESLRDLYGYDFRITGRRVLVLPNTVQTRLFRINYLPGRRQGTTDLRVTSSSISVASGSSSTASDSATTTNNTPAARADNSSHVRTSSDADFWREVQASMNALVGTQPGQSVVLNPSAGVIVVRATPATLRQIESYLAAIQVSIQRQVMLEAKIVEVVLSKESQTGINWSAFGKLFNDIGVSIGVGEPGAILAPSGTISSADGTTSVPGTSLNPGSIGRGFYGLALQAPNFAALLNFLQTQGDVTVLSSPRIATLNNQKAVLKVGSDELYVTGISTSTTTSGTSAVATPNVTLQPFFSGIALDVTPQIDGSGNVILHVHPSISSVTERQKNVDLGALGAYRLPLATSAINETDSIVRVRDGQIVAIGGLMKQETRGDKTGVPGLSEIPGVGALFRQTTSVTTKRELVILMKPTIIQDEGAWPDAGPAAAALAN